MKVASKLFNSKASALQAGCCETDLSEKNGVWYCVCSTTKQKEAKPVKSTKEFKTDGIKTTKDDNITKKIDNNGI